MSVFIRPIGSNNIFHFFDDKESPNSIKTISYLLDQDGLIKVKWEKLGTVSKLTGALNSLDIGKSKIISHYEWKTNYKWKS